jgi:restriction endonuclease
MGYHSSTFDPKKHTRYQPINEEKYVGKEYPCCRSSWETHFCKWCDNNPSIIKWSSEAIQIPYYDPVRRKNRRYYPDFSMSVKGSDGKVINYIVEIKPYKETIQPSKGGNKKDKTIMYEFYTFQTNMAKWKAAIDFCRKHGIVFKLLTEKDLFKGGTK